LSSTASQSSRDVRIVALADANLARAKSLSKRFDINYCTDDYRQLFERTDEVVISLPNYLDASVANHYYAFSQGQIDLYTTNVLYNIDKARRMLDYHPRIDFARGMELTSAWMKWARL